MLKIVEKKVALDVELEMLIDGHTHAGNVLSKGAHLHTNPERAARMIALGQAKKVGVFDPKKTTRKAKVKEEPEVEAEEAEVDGPDEDDED